MMFCKSYLLDHRARALRWAKSNDGKSEIITTHGTYFSDLTPIELLEQVCIRFLSTKEGRKEGSKFLFKFEEFPPYICAPDLGVFQTTSSMNFDCVWILNAHFASTNAEKKGQTIITFDEGISITVPAAKTFIDQQRILLHRLLLHNGNQLSYMLPGSKEFNYLYH